MKIYKSDELEDQDVFLVEDVAELLLNMKGGVHDARQYRHMKHKIEEILDDIESGYNPEDDEPDPWDDDSWVHDPDMEARG